MLTERTADRPTPSVQADERAHRALEGVCRRDVDGLAELFQMYAPVMKGLAFAVLRDRSASEDVIQDVFLALWSDPTRYRRDRGRPRAWLLAATHHRAVDYVRRAQAERRRRQAGAPTNEEGLDTSEEVIEAMFRSHVAVEVREALDAIPAEQRRVIEMMYFEAKPQTRIAEELGLPLGTVKSRTLLGMRRLRAALDAEELAS